MKKRTLAALLAVLTLLGLAACGEKKNEIQKISWQAAPAGWCEASSQKPSCNLLSCRLT